MDVLTQQLMKQLAGAGLSKISQKVGADEQTTSTVMSTVMPLLVTALARNAAKPDGAQSLHKALVEDHDGGILNNLSGYLNAPETANGDGILKHVLGGQQPVVTQALARQTGLENNQVGQILQIAAPLLMGALGQQQKQQGLDISSLAAFLGNQQKTDQQENPGLMSTLNSLLDFDGDGSAVDDVIGMFGQLFGKK
ncbi:MAG: DUF937 domain-containing protein [Anaerolineales bacterium]